MSENTNIRTDIGQRPRNKFYIHTLPGKEYSHRFEHLQ